MHQLGINLTWKDKTVVFLFLLFWIIKRLNALLKLVQGEQDETYDKNSTTELSETEERFHFPQQEHALRSPKR